MQSPQSHVEALPADLIYDIIIDILAEYLHLAIINPHPRAWNAFTVLPRVSRLFHSLTQPLFLKIFGESSINSVNIAHRAQRFATSKALWSRATADPCPPWIPESENFSPEDIPRPYKRLRHPPSLLAIYDLVSRGRYFFNIKAIHVETEDPMCSLRLWYPYMGESMRMCNSIFSRRLLTFVGPHVAAQTTYCYSLECVHGAKSALETLLKPPEFFDAESYISQNLESLKNLEENKWRFLWLGGFISQTYSMCITPTKEMLESAKILEAIRAVAAYDWQEDEYHLRTRAEELYKIYTSRIQAASP